MPTRSTPIPPGTDPAQQNSIINKNFGELDAFMTAPLFYDVNGVPSISIGVQQDKSSRIKVAKPGKDVTTATDADLAFNSAQNVFKIVATGTLSLTANTTAGTPVNVFLTHNLGYIPIPWVFMLIAGAYYQLPTYTGRSFTAGAVNFNNWIDCTTDNTILQVSFYSSITANWGTFAFRYYLLQETAN